MVTVGKVNRLISKVARFLFYGTLCCASIIYLAQLITHFPFFDETINARYLWLIVNGYRPHVDFFCIYPTLGYFLTAPYFTLFPDSSLVVLALRFISAAIVVLMGVIYWSHGSSILRAPIVVLLPFFLVITDPATGAFLSEYSLDHMAALAALWAMVLMMSKPGAMRLVLCSALCVISFFLMPKYHLPLFFGLVGYLWTYYFQTRRLSHLVFCVSSGALAAILAILIAFALNHASIAENFRFAYLFNLSLSSVLKARISNTPLFGAVGSHLANFFCQHLLLAALYAWGIAGWFRYSMKNWRLQDQRVLAGGGILTGCLLSMFSSSMYTEQYLIPPLLCFGLFMPFSLSEIASGAARKYITAALVLVVFYMLALRVGPAAEGFRETPLNSRGNTAIERKLLGEVILAPPGVAVLSDYTKLLQMIPKNEVIVAAWPYHPLFRRDLTFQIYDDLPSLSLGLSKDDPLHETFAPGTFKAALDSHPPALIVLEGMDEYYPQKWNVIASEFLSRQNDRYVLCPTSFIKAYVRRDLLDRSSTSSPGAK